MRDHDEAVHVEGGDDKGADFTLPRKNAISDLWDHGKPRKNAGESCSTAKECSSDSCVRLSDTCWWYSYLPVPTTLGKFRPGSLVFFYCYLMCEYNDE